MKKDLGGLKVLKIDFSEKIILNYKNFLSPFVANFPTSRALENAK